MIFKDEIQRVGDAAGLKGEFLVDYGTDHIIGVLNGRGRAAEMLKIAAEYIKEHCPDMTVEYDETICDGYCVADDCLDAADGISPEVT